MRLGVLGGTFDPIHNAHLFISMDAAASFGLEKVLIIPNAVPPHKPGQPVTEPHHRLQMVELAVHGNRLLEADPLEVKRGGISYTVETLRELRRRYPDSEILFLTGADAVAEIGTWREPKTVVRLCRLVAVSRPGLGLAELRARVPAELFPFIELHQVPPMGISSTMIRERVQRGLPIRYLTPDAVVDYIEEHRLYRT